MKIKRSSFVFHSEFRYSTLAVKIRKCVKLEYNGLVKRDLMRIKLTDNGLLVEIAN